MNQNEPQPELGADMPDYLSDAAKKHWDVVYKQLVDARVMSRMDQTALVLYCETFARWREAMDKMKDGIVVMSPNNFPVQSPYLAIANRAQEQMVSLLREFGMTPSARTKVSTVKAAPTKSRLSLAIGGGASDK